MKNKVVLVLALIATSSTVQFTRAQTALQINQTNKQVILYWTGTFGGTNCVLNSANSTTPFNWAAATDAVPFNYGTKTALSVTSSVSERYFRLSLIQAKKTK